MQGDRLYRNIQPPKPGSLEEALMLMKGTRGSEDLIPILSEIAKNKVRKELLERKFREYGVENWTDFFLCAQTNSLRIGIRLKVYMEMHTQNEAVVLEQVDRILDCFRF